jgi:hypothetical protein
LLRARSGKELFSCAFGKPTAQPQFMVGPTSKKLRFLLNQTTIYVVVGEPHPQPQYQITTIYIWLKLWLELKVE